MSNASNYLENQFIDHVFRTATFSKPAALYYELYTVAPTAAGGGTVVSGGSYARAPLSPLNTNYNATQGGTSGASSGTTGLTSNAVAITFPAPTANWGTVVAYGLFDAITGGNFLAFGALNVSKTINNGDAAPAFAIGNFQMTVS